MLTGVGRVIWNDFGLFPRPDLHVERIYDRAGSESAEIGHKQHGQLVGLRYLTNDHNVLLEGSHAMVHGAFSTAIGLSIVAEESEGTRTRILLKPTVMMTTFSNLMYRVNHVITDEDGVSLFNSTRIVAHADTDEFNWLVKREVGEQACRELVDQGLAFYMHLGPEDVHRELWESLFDGDHDH